MSRLIRILILWLGFAGLSVVSLAQADQNILITGAWARATADPSMARSYSSDGPVSAAYVTIENTGDHAISLVGVATSTANIAEIHETTIENNIMKMRPIDGLEIGAGQTVALKPGNYHIMLMDLKQDLVTSAALALTLTFDPMDGSGTTTDVVIGVPVLDQAPAESSIIVMDAWARATAAAPADMSEATPEATSPADNPVSAAYMTLFNQGDQADRLVGVTSEAAAIVEIHETTIENDIMKMRPVDGMGIPAGEAVELKPGSYHIMLMDLKRDLFPGEAITLTLTFESGQQLAVGVPVKDDMMDMGQ